MSDIFFSKTEIKELETKPDDFILEFTVQIELKALLMTIKEVNQLKYSDYAHFAMYHFCRKFKEFFQSRFKMVVIRNEDIEEKDKLNPKV